MTQKTVLQRVGANIKTLRKSALTPEGYRGINKFASWVGVPNGTVDRIERGATDPQLSHLIRIAAKYETHGIQLWHLFVAGLNPLDLPAYLNSKEKQFHDQAEKAFAELRATRDSPRSRVSSS